MFRLTLIGCIVTTSLIQVHAVRHGSNHLVWAWATPANHFTNKSEHLVTSGATAFQESPPSPGAPPGAGEPIVDTLSTIVDTLSTQDEPEGVDEDEEEDGVKARLQADAGELKKRLAETLELLKTQEPPSSPGASEDAPISPGASHDALEPIVDTFSMQDEQNGKDDHKAEDLGLPSPEVHAVHEVDEAKEEFIADGVVHVEAEAKAFTEVEGLTCALEPGVTTGRRVVSMADQHGDFPHMLEHLQRLGLVSKTVTADKETWHSMWTGGEATFVQTGDILDRGPNGKLMAHFLWALQDQAAEACPAGKVVLLMGNHELLVLQGDVRYVTNVDFCEYSADVCEPEQHLFCDDRHGDHKCCTSYEPWECKDCLQGNCKFLAAWDIHGYMGAEFRKRVNEGKIKVAHKVNDVVYAHAELLPRWFAFNGYKGSPKDVIEAVNEEFKLLMQKSMGELYDLGGGNNPHPILNGESRKGGPVWTRLCNWDTFRKCSATSDALESLGAKRMVIGHCPQANRDGSSPGVTADCGGTFLLADTFMSMAYCRTEENAMNNMAAIEFYDDRPNDVWAIYAGRDDSDQCVQIEIQ